MHQQHLSGKPDHHERNATLSSVPSGSMPPDLSSLHAHPQQQSFNPSQSATLHDVSKGRLSNLQLSLPRLHLPRPQALLAEQQWHSGSADWQSRAASQGTTILCPAPGICPQRLDSVSNCPPNPDTLRRTAESEYYEEPAKGGTTRQDSMRRTVSKEDYLLGRGANPRTGMITPGIYSTGNSFEEAERMHTEAMSAPSKWRQKGDQWICLDVAQNTPLPTPQLQVQPGLTNRKLRVPQQLSETSIRHARGQFRSVGAAPVRNVDGNARITRSYPSNQSAEVMSGAFPVTPVETGIAMIAASSTVGGPAVRRKPVGGLSLQNNSIALRTHAALSYAGSDSARGGPGTSQARSSSAPTPRKDHPANKTLQVPDAQRQVSASRPSHAPGLLASESMPFLGIRPGPVTQEMALSPDRSRGPLQIDKELPCLPTSSGQSPLLPSTQQHRRKPQPHGSQGTTSRLMPPISRPSGPRGGSPDYSYHQFKRNRHIPLSKIMDQDGLRWVTGKHSMAAVPSYDNPPENQLARPTHNKVEGPRRMPPVSQNPVARVNGTHIAQDPFTIISTSTDTFTRETSSRHLQQSRSDGLLRHTPQAITGFRTATVTAALHTDIDMSIPPIPRMRPRNMTRPSMPTRAAGLHSVPKIPRLSEIQNMTFTGRRQPSNMTGMPGRQSTGPVQKGDMEKERLQAQAMIESCKPEVEPARQIELQRRPTENTSQEVVNANSNGLTRKCSRCYSGFVISKLPSIVGLTTTDDHEQPIVEDGMFDCALPDCLTSISELDERRSSQTTTHGQQCEVLQDHKVEEKKFDDHQVPPSTNEDMALRQQHLHGLSPILSAARSVQSSLSQPSSPTSTTPTSESEATSPCKRSTAKRSKLSFVTRNLRKTLREGLTPSSENYPTPMITPHSFWGGDGAGASAGAASAARRAIEVNNPFIGNDNAAAAARKATEAHFPGSQDDKLEMCNDLMVPKLRLNNRSNIKIDQPKTIPVSRTGRQPLHRSKDAIKKTDEEAVSAHTPRYSIKDTEIRKTIPLESSATAATLQSRNVSGASLETLRMLQFSNMGVNTFWELFLIPFEASRMWFRNNPQMLSYVWQGAERAWEMGCLINITAQRAFGVVYVYSKTGKLRLGRGVTTAEFAGDSLRCILYLILFAMIAVMLGRVLRALLLPMRLVLLIGRFVIGLLGRVIKAVMS